ncbi:hypothetical protein E2986_07846 [Frieseomelitta varia]|uniref:Uncharacterized protein n=1 Tax=Frieseomelitta varia TaxID=561572 RepID=A0A833VVM9_9HYME|nr:eukaryotic translation initiation factor 5B-like [Frieseomelitta varia]KAF3421994.1 hypothetical protein E2986_07846 [Frieseomelitta varia]
MAPKMKKPAKDKVGRRDQNMKEMKEPTKPPRAAAGRLRKVERPKLKAKRVRRKLKGWLATPADWTRFNAWAKINALPKKYPEPEPIVRPSRPLSQLKKRIKMLAKPKERPDESIHCRLDLTISKMALRAIPSKRTILLALPKIRLVDFGRIYYQVSPAALKYQPTRRIIELSMPRVFIKEEYKPSRLQERVLDEERLSKLALAKKLLDHSGQLTKEELEELFTYGVKKTARLYQITPWISFLAMPSYRMIKDREDEQAKTFKKTIIEEEEKRGKKAFAEYKRRKEEKRRGKKRSRKIIEAEEEVYETEEKEREAKRRKLEKYAWRVAPYPCINIPIPIKKAVLKTKASPRTVELAKPRERKYKTFKTDPFTIKKGALEATATERIESLAKPKSPRSLIERKPPRKKDKYGRPIFEMPIYGRVLPKMKPYKMGNCPEPKKEKPPAKKRPIDPIIYEATYDPCIYPDLAKRQKIERKRAEKLLKKKPRRKKKLERPEHRGPTEAEDKKEEVEEKETGETVDKTETELTEVTEETEVTEGTDVTAEVTEETEVTEGTDVTAEVTEETEVTEGTDVTEVADEPEEERK